MNYSLEKELNNISFEDAIIKITNALKLEGFGILNEIDMKATLKKKIDEDIKPYMVLGACNPTFAHKALLADDKIGVFLPCSVVVKENKNGSIGVTVVNPSFLSDVVDSEELKQLMLQLDDKMRKVMEEL